MSSKESKKKASDNVQAFVEAINELCDSNSSTYLYGPNQNKNPRLAPSVLAHEIGPAYCADGKTHRQVLVYFMANATYLKLAAVKVLNSLAQEHDICLSGIDFNNKNLYFVEGGC